MQPAFKDLRACLFGSQEDVEFFRTLLVKTILATDLWDKEMSDERRRRWESVMSDSTKQSFGNYTSEVKVASERAIVVVEHLIQVSDVSHTVQHFNVFSKWNNLLFKEMFLGHKTGRAANDPSTNWYQSEILFFEHHVVPLAKRLCECKVFRASADIALTNALTNKRKWEQKGESVVKDYLEVYQTRSAAATLISQRVKRTPSLIVPPTLSRDEKKD
jgi:hypothetical protein